MVRIVTIKTHEPIPADSLARIQRTLDASPETVTRFGHAYVDDGQLRGTWEGRRFVGFDYCEQVWIEAVRE